MSELLTKGNTKTGPRIMLFNLPRVDTCIGATPLCISLCYAGRGRYSKFHAEDSHKQKLKMAKHPDFADRMIREITERKYQVVRIHTVGDFYDGTYVAAWVKVAKACPQTVFYGYTRSWRDATVLRGLNKLRRLPNVQLWWSADRETGQPPEGLVAYMAVDDADLPPYQANLVFRVERKTVRKTMGGVGVCPKENGLPTNGKLTCSTCRVCFSSALTSVGGPLPARRLTPAASRR